MVGTIFNLAEVNTVPCMCAAVLSLSDNAYTESITDAYSEYFVNDIKHTENNRQYQKCKLLLVRITSTSYCQLLCYLIISAERTAR